MIEIKDIDPEKIQELKAVLDKTHTTTKLRYNIVKRYVGTCVSCYEIPTKIVTYDVSDADMSAKKIERYCDNCFKRSGIDKQVLLTATNGIDETIAQS